MSLDARIVRIVQDEMSRILSTTDLTVSEPSPPVPVERTEQDGHLQQQITKLAAQFSHLSDQVESLCSHQDAVPRRPTRKRSEP